MPFEARLGFAVHAPGVPCVYYGDEVGLAGGEDPFNRACFLGNENAELLDHYRTLGRIRKLCPAFIDGEFNCISSVLGCIAYERNSESGSALIIANANCHGIEYTVPERWRGASTLFRQRRRRTQCPARRIFGGNTL